MRCGEAHIPQTPPLLFSWGYVCTSIMRFGPTVSPWTDHKIISADLSEEWVGFVLEIDSSHFGVCALTQLWHPRGRLVGIGDAPGRVHVGSLRERAEGHSGAPHRRVVLRERGRAGAWERERATGEVLRPWEG